MAEAQTVSVLAGQEWTEQFRRELTENILPFWIRHTTDPGGGFYGEVDCDLNVHRESARTAVINTRLLWTFSAVSRVLPDATYRETADRAYRYIVENFWDPEFGGIYWMVDHLGRPLSIRKQIYAQAFGIYALAEYFQATRKTEALDRARELYRLIEKKSGESSCGGYLEALSRDWQPLEDLRLSEKDLNCPKSMNTHLHVLEAYTNLLRVWPDSQLREKLRQLIVLFLDRIVDPASSHFHLFFDNGWTSLNDHISYGHDIEGSWLLLEAAEALGDPAILARARRTSLCMAQAVYDQGLDHDGSLFYEASGGRLIDPNKHWWAQAEAVVGFYNAYQLSEQEHFHRAASRAWEFIRHKVVDRVHGEWHAKLKLDGTPWTEAEDSDACLAGPWKCPYHNSRMCLEMMARLS